MPDRSQAVSELDGYLEEIDRRLRRVQLELVSGTAAEPVAEVSLPETSEAPRPHEAPRPPETPPQPRSGPLADLLASLAASMPPPDPESPTDPELLSVLELPPDPEPPVGEPPSGPPPSQLQSKLLATMRELIDAFESALAQAPAAAGLTISAGPFHSIAAVRQFERALAALPGVSEVVVRGYEGEDRAILDVNLGETAPGDQPG